MIAEIGHYALVLALALALIQSTVPMLGARCGDRRADECRAAGRAGAIRCSSRCVVRRADRAATSRPISRSPTCSRIRIR